jgi:hypothetical protein
MKLLLGLLLLILLEGLGNESGPEFFETRIHNSEPDHSPVITMAPRAVGPKTKAEKATIKAAGSTKSSGSGGDKGSVLNTRDVKRFAEALDGDWPNKTDKWAGNKKCFCLSCTQHTSTIDKHSHPDRPAYVAWVMHRKTTLPDAIKAAKAKAKKSAAASKAGAKSTWEEDLKYPCGNECYSCYDVRRSFYKGKNQAEILAMREADPDEDDVHNSRRQDKVSGENKLKGDKKKHYTVEKAEQNQKREFLGGTFEPIDKFARDRNLQAPDGHDPQYRIDALVDVVRDKYPQYRIVIDKRGTVQLLPQFMRPYEGRLGSLGAPSLCLD